MQANSILPQNSRDNQGIFPPAISRTLASLANGTRKRIEQQLNSFDPARLDEIEAFFYRFWRLSPAAQQRVALAILTSVDNGSL